MSDNRPPYIKEINFQVNKLIKTLEYDYEIDVGNAPGNWPVVAIPRSGSFIANNRTETINSTIIFCPNTGICGTDNPDALPYNIDYSCGFKNKDLLFTNLRLKVNEKNTNDYIYSNIQHIECEECLTNTIVQFSGYSAIDNTENNSLVLTSDTKNILKLQTYLTGLIPGQSYNWYYSNNSSNWPITIVPLSGSFIAPNKTFNLNSLITFCENIFCSGSPGYLSFTEDHLSLEHKYINLNFTINNEEHCFIDNPSYNLNIYCDNCIETKNQTHLFKTNVAPGNYAVINGKFSNLVPNQIYDYSFEPIGGNWPIKLYPTSGSFVAKTETYDVMSDVIFCCPSGGCEESVFAQNIETNSYLNNNLYYNIRLNLIKNDQILSYDESSVNSNLPDISIVSPAQAINLDNTSKGCYLLNAGINNANSNYTYHYEYKVIDSNWPIYFDNISGFFSNERGFVDISTNLTFCPSVSSCSNTSGVWPATKNTNNKLNNYCNNNKHYATLSIEVFADCYPESKVFVSEAITVYCNDCIPVPSVNS
jgi:hypothetical protein